MQSFSVTVGEWVAGCGNQGQVLKNHNHSPLSRESGKMTAVSFLRSISAMSFGSLSRWWWGSWDGDNVGDGPHSSFFGDDASVVEEEEKSNDEVGTCRGLDNVNVAAEVFPWQHLYTTSIIGQAVAKDDAICDPLTANNSNFTKKPPNGETNTSNCYPQNAITSAHRKTTSNFLSTQSWTLFLKMHFEVYWECCAPFPVCSCSILPTFLSVNIFTLHCKMGRQRIIGIGISSCHTYHVTSILL